MTETKKINILIILVITIVGIYATMALQQFLEDNLLEANGAPMSFTRFSVTNKSATFLQHERSVSYRVIIENLENRTIDYDLKILFNGDVIYNKSIRLDNGDIWDKIMSVKANFNKNVKNKYAKIEFLLYKDNQLYKSVISQIMIFEKKKEGISRRTDKSKGDTFPKDVVVSVSRVDDTVIYNFKEGDKLELNISHGKIGLSDATYVTTVKGDRIALAGKIYERALATRVDYLFPIIYDIKNKTLGIGGVLHLKNGYSIVIADIGYVPYNKKEKVVKLKIMKNRKPVRYITHTANSVVEYWKDINDYKKKKILRIRLKRVNIGKGKSVVLDVTQYEKAIMIIPGIRYGEFIVTNVTDDTIIMKNDEVINVKTGETLSLMNGMIKVKI